MTLLALLLCALAAAAPVGVAVDPTVETLAILARLARLPGWTAAPETPYTRSVDRRFGPYAGHPAVRALAQAAAKQGAAHDAPLSFALHLQAGGLAPEARPWPGRLDPRWRGADLPALADAVAAFARDADTAAFFAEQAPLHRALEARAAAALQPQPLADWLDARFGAPLVTTRTVHPSPLAGPVTWGLAVERGGHLALHPVVGVARLAPDGGPLFDRAAALQLAHELCHGHSSPALGRHPALAAAAAAAWAHARGVLQPRGYADAAVFVDESVVRGMVALWAEQRGGPAVAAALAAEDAAQGFPLTAALARALAAGDGPLEARAASLAPAFSAWAAAPAWPPFAGGLDEALALARRDGGARLSLPAHPGARAYLDGALPRLPLVAHERGPRALFGGPSDPAVAAALRALGWSIGPAGLTLKDAAGESTLPGPRLALLAAVPDPEDPRRPLILGVATDPADLVGLWGLPLDGADFAVGAPEAGGLALIARGRFER